MKNVVHIRSFTCNKDVNIRKLDGSSGREATVEVKAFEDVRGKTERVAWIWLERDTGIVWMRHVRSGHLKGTPVTNVREMVIDEKATAEAGGDPIETPAPRAVGGAKK